MTVTRLVACLAGLYPWETEASDELDRALCYLGTDLSAETVVSAGYGAAVLLLPVPALGVVLSPPVLVPIVGLLGLAGVLCVIHGVHALPGLLATMRRTRALGEAPALVSRAVLRMRIEPATERAAAFAAETGTGPLAASLGDHVRRAAGTPGSGLSTFSTEWREWFPALRRSMLLVEAAGDAPAGERERTLDRSLAAVLDGTREEMTEFAAALRGPTTALYAFGVLLPLALVGLLPAATMTGVPASLSALVVIYDLVLPAVLGVACVWLLVRRPVTFPPPSVGRGHPDVPDRRWAALGLGFAVALATYLVTTAVVAGWMGPLTAAACGLGALLVAYYRPITAVRRRVEAVESGLADALYHVGRRVEAGTSVEAAIDTASDDVTDETAAVFADAARRQRQLKVGVREAFLGKHGALATVPSTRARTTATLLAIAAREGRPAGGAIVAVADNIEELADVERRARHEIGTVTATLANTAALFGPLVAGATVALADGMAGGGMPTGEGFATSGLGIAVGVYVLLLAALLTTLSTGLARGLDRALVGYRVGWALVAASLTYAAAFHVVGLLV